jgi:hypothetical protein
VGCHHDKPKSPCCARVRRPRTRICLRQGCGRKYQPRRWNQRYCQEPDCQRQVRRWQAAQRQARCRLDAAAKARQAEAQRVRRQRARSASQTPKNSEDAAARGHAAEVFFRLPCAPGQGAMNHRKSRSAIRHATAAPPAVRPFIRSWIANASGGRVALWMVAANAPTSIRPPAGNGPKINATGPARRLLSEDALGPCRSSLIVWSGRLA